MATWKVLVTVLLGLLSFALAMGTLIALISGGMDYRWLWFGGLLVGTLFMGTLLTLFLRAADRTYVQDTRHRGTLPPPARSVSEVVPSRCGSSHLSERPRWAPARFGGVPVPGVFRGRPSGEFGSRSGGRSSPPSTPRGSTGATGPCTVGNACAPTRSARGAGTRPPHSRQRSTRSVPNSSPLPPANVLAPAVRPAVPVDLRGHYLALTLGFTLRRGLSLVGGVKVVTYRRLMPTG
jgi:hypothetical protein